VLEIEQVHSGDHTGSPMVADIELVADEDPEIKRLQLVILESLVIRRDIAADTQGSTATRLLVEVSSTRSSSGAYGNSVQRSGRYSRD